MTLLHIHHMLSFVCLLCSTICGDVKEGCYRNTSCALNLISTSLLLSLGHLLMDSPDGIIRPVVSVSALTLFISYNYNRNLQASICDFSGLWLSCLDPLIVLLQTFGKLFGFQIFLLWVYLLNIIPECHCILLNKNIFIWCTKSISEILSAITEHS